MKRLILGLLVLFLFQNIFLSKSLALMPENVKWISDCKEKVLTYCDSTHFRSAVTRCAWVVRDRFGVKCQKYIQTYAQTQLATSQFFQFCKILNPKTCFQNRTDHPARCIKELPTKDPNCLAAREEYLKMFFKFDNLIQYELGYGNGEVFE